jgi:SAM-dependent methyltransferase
MHESVMEFGKRVLSVREVQGKAVLEVGSLNVNGSLRQHIMTMLPATYVGVDLVWGPGVDVTFDWCTPDLGGMMHGWRGWFGLVVCTEMLEHARDWRVAVSNLKRALAPHGILLLTTRSQGFALHHEHPGDFWRFELGDMQVIFGDLEILALESDPGGSGGGPGVFLKARKPDLFVERDLAGYGVYAMGMERP